MSVYLLFLYFVMEDFVIFLSENYSFISSCRSCIADFAISRYVHILLFVTDFCIDQGTLSGSRCFWPCSDWVRTTFSTPLSLLIYVLCSIITLSHVLCILPTPIFCWFHVSAQPLPPTVLALQPPQSGTHYPLASAVLPLQTLSLGSLKLTASSRPTAPPSGSVMCLRFGHWLTVCTLNMHLLTYLPVHVTKTHL